jgi:hypothetical protein
MNANYQPLYPRFLLCSVPLHFVPNIPLPPHVITLLCANIYGYSASRFPDDSLYTRRSLALTANRIATLIANSLQRRAYTDTAFQRPHAQL